MDISKALDKNGFIINQSKLTDIPFGKYTADKHGCGLIAIYNAIKAVGIEPDLDDLIAYFKKYAYFGGKFGSNALQISVYLHKYHLDNGYMFCKKNFSKVDVGILWYKHSAGWHYVAFYSVGNGKFNFLNADKGKNPNVCTMDKFFERYVKSKIYAVFVVKKGG